MANRHDQRRQYFIDPLIELCGGDLKGKRILDLGCNAGYWSLIAAESGADYILGIDGRQMHVDQSNFVFEVKGINKGRYDFVQGDIFKYDFSQHGSFDVVLCLGLLYHLSKPVDLMETISSVNDDILLIDTNLSAAPRSYIQVNFEDSDKPLNAWDRDLVLIPSKQAVVDIMRAFGYETIVLKPNFTSYSGSRRYRQGRRKAFIGAKKTPLDVLKERSEPSHMTAREIFWLGADLPFSVAARVRRKRAS